MNEAPKPGTVITHDGVEYRVEPEHNRNNPNNRKCDGCDFAEQNKLNNRTVLSGKPRIPCPGPPCQNYNRSYEGLHGVIFVQVESEAPDAE